MISAISETPFHLAALPNHPACPFYWQVSSTHSVPDARGGLLH